MNYSVRSVDLNSFMKRLRALGNCGFARRKFIAVESLPQVLELLDRDDKNRVADRSVNVYAAGLVCFTRFNSFTNLWRREFRRFFRK